MPWLIIIVLCYIVLYFPQKNIAKNIITIQATHKKKPQLINLDIGTGTRKPDIKVITIASHLFGDTVRPPLCLSVGLIACTDILKHSCTSSATNPWCTNGFFLLILYNKLGCMLTFPNGIVFLSLKIDFLFANSADTDEETR